MRVFRRMMLGLTLAMLASCATTIASTHAEDRWLDFPPQPRNAAMLLATIKFAFDRNVFSHDAAYDVKTVTRLFGGVSASFRSGSIHPTSGAIEDPGVCGSGGLCARALTFAKGIRPDGSTYSNVSATLVSTMSADDVQKLLGVQGKAKFDPVLLVHRITPPSTARGGNAILEYDLGRNGGFEVWFAPDATVERVGFIRND